MRKFEIKPKLEKKLITPGRIRYNLIEAITNKKRGLNSLVGRKEIKESILTTLYAFSNSYKIYINTFNNYCLMGKSGTGKTAIAKVISYVFSKCKINFTTDSVY